MKLSFNGMSEGEFDIDTLMTSIGMEYRALSLRAGALVVQAIMNAECEKLAGARYSRGTSMDRWGSETGYAIMGGQKVQVQRLRVRDKQKKEVRWKVMNDFKMRIAEQNLSLTVWWLV